MHHDPCSSPEQSNCVPLCTVLAAEKYTGSNGLSYGQTTKAASLAIKYAYTDYKRHIGQEEFSSGNPISQGCCKRQNTSNTYTQTKRYIKI